MLSKQDIKKFVFPKDTIGRICNIAFVVMVIALFWSGCRG